MSQVRPVVGLIGAGRAASALALGLSRTGYTISAIQCLHGKSAARLALRIPGSRVATSSQDVINSSDLVLVAVPDSAIAPIVASVTWRDGLAVVHTSGVQSREALYPAEAAGSHTGSIHPLQTFADTEHGWQKLSGSVFAIEAEGSLRETLTELAVALGGKPLYLSAEDKGIYHASAVIASNYIVTLAKLASDLWLSFGWERQAALQALLPLMRGAVENLDALGLPTALTGPVARGDIETIARHLDALTCAAPDLRPLYAELALQTLPIALARSELSEEASAQLKDLLQAAPAIHALEGDKV